ncbi:Phosphotriesterase-related protein [Actinidia chinensis var. chinensis]|uniref:Phosphotriesterase-related protein n=1 Tax=Actinidia chinensis var. chinensis TaxID=1590841 RepID=A0A2R6QC38_ACTCC|nr:Phosphotriesterase-related protein [Actinidia chinensis var. chinensis]
MDNSHQNQPQAYSAAAVEGLYVVPPPVGYPMKDGQVKSQNYPPQGKTKARGGGFWEGCCVGLCCCCLLDACF